MKKPILIGLIAILSLSFCSKKASDTTTTTQNCGYHNGKQLHLGSEGGCYYYSSGNNKEYVDRSECNCN